MKTYESINIIFGVVFVETFLINTFDSIYAFNLLTIKKFNLYYILLLILSLKKSMVAFEVINNCVHH